MKKLLLSTSTLMAAGLLATSAAAAPTTPTITVGGFIDFQALVADQDTATVDDYFFQNDTEVHFSVDGRHDNSGTEYGAVIELEADIAPDRDSEGLNADKTYLYLSGENWGRLELGSNSAVTHTMKVDASTFAAATGGVDGDWYDAVVFPAGSFIVSPDLVLDHGLSAFGDSEDAAKITYYTPRHKSGLQFGISLTPDSGDPSTAAAFSGDSVDAEDVVSLGLNLKRTMGSVNVEASLTGEMGDAEAPGVEDLQAWAAGLTLNYRGLSLGGSYGDWGDSLTVSGTDASFWTAGLGYEMGPFATSLTYIDSENANNDFTNLSLGADYKLAPGLVPYVEVNFFELDPSVGTDNDGTVFLVGTELTF